MLLGFLFSPIFRIQFQMSHILMMGSVLRLAASGTGCFQAAVLTSCHHAAAVGTSCRFSGSLAPAKPVITIPVKVRQEIQDKSIHQSTRFEIQKTLCISDRSGTGLTISLTEPTLGKKKAVTFKRQCLKKAVLRIRILNSVLLTSEQDPG